MKPLTIKQEADFTAAEICHICQGKLRSDRVKDLCHITGKYRGSAYDECNLQYTAPNFVPVVFHSFRGFDSHIIVEAFDNKDIINRLKINNNNKILYIPSNTEKYMSVTLGKIRFINSLQFMAASLVELVKGCVSNLTEHFGEKSSLLTRKGIFPYEYLNDWDTFDETNLPDKDTFYSRSNLEIVSYDDYAYSKSIWDSFDCKTSVIIMTCILS